MTVPLDLQVLSGLSSTAISNVAYLGVDLRFGEPRRFPGQIQSIHRDLESRSRRWHDFRAPLASAAFFRSPCCQPPYGDARELSTRRPSVRRNALRRSSARLPNVCPGVHASARVPRRWVRDPRTGFPPFSVTSVPPCFRFRVCVARGFSPDNVKFRLRFREKFANFSGAAHKKLCQA